MSKNQVIYNISDLITLAPLAAEKRGTSITEADLGRTTNGWVAMSGGKVVAVGKGDIPRAYQSFDGINGEGCLVIPGLVDSHTHALFAGERADEFCARARGKTYQDIAQAGGGIASTVRATRQASDEMLEELLVTRLEQWNKLGVTTIEVKSGYGLNVEEELRHLRIIKKAKNKAKSTIVATCLALHADSPDYPSRAAYIQDVITKLLPVVAEEKLATFVDAFVEQGYFSVADVREYFQAAHDLGLRAKLHADEFSDAEAALFSAEINAVSADHLQCASESGIAAMAKHGVVATLLPGTSLYTKLPFRSAKVMQQKKTPLAIASDFNPGSCYIGNLPLIASIAMVQCGLTPEETIAGITYVAAMALNIHYRKGALAPGYDADLVMYQGATLETWLASFGALPTWKVHTHKQGWI